MSDAVITALRTDSHWPLLGATVLVDDPLTGEDSHLALHCCYELFHDGYDGVDDRWEWEPALLRLRRRLEDRFLVALRAEHRPSRPPSATETPDALRRVIERGAGGPSPSRYLDEQGSVAQLREVLVHRSIYQRKEADAHTFAIPRLRGAAKSAMVTIQADEYGAGRPGRTHAELFGVTMSRLGLDPTPGAYIDVVPGVALATDNLASMFGLHRRLRAAVVGHLAVFEMTSIVPMGRYANAVRRLTGDDLAAEFYDVHVAADAEHEVIASRDLAAGFVRDEPTLAGDVVFGAAALMRVEARLAGHLVTSWEAGRSSLYAGSARRARLADSATA
ncbi:MAG: iron-containing redox enzyme family protein [Acidimicrobiales bacterium]